MALSSVDLKGRSQIGTSLSSIINTEIFKCAGTSASRASVGKWRISPTSSMQTNAENWISTRQTSSYKTSTSGRENSRISHTSLDSANKGWTDDLGRADERVLSKFRALAVLASDRTEMHSILAKQRDNWNRLFHTTITVASVSAAAASALNGANQALGLSVVAATLGVGVAALMTLVSKFQPSQLAEEQRHAARFFERLRAEIEAYLLIDPRLRQHASDYWEQKVGTLHALDEGFPLPLTPVVLEKFPKQVRPSKLSRATDDVSLPESAIGVSHQAACNGWTSSGMQDLKRTAQLLHTADVPAYVNMAKTINNANLVMAIMAPVLASAGALLSIGGATMSMHCSCLAAALTVGALFVHTTAHALQLGAVFEVYRNCAGYYADVEKSICEALRTPVEEREDGILFRHKISLQLGRVPSTSPIVSAQDDTAGKLF